MPVKAGMWFEYGLRRHSPYGLTELETVPDVLFVNVFPNPLTPDV